MGRAVRAKRARHVVRGTHAHTSDMSKDGTIEIIKPVQCPHGPGCFSGTQREVIFYSNGVNTPIESERATAQQMANKTGRNITMVHNGTSNLAKDLFKLTQANLGKHVYAAAEEEAELLEEDLLEGKPAIILCHSAGCAQVNEALSDLRSIMREQVNPATGVPYTDQEITALERASEVRLDYGPANTRLEKGPYSRITVRERDVATPLHLAKGDYDERVTLPRLEKQGGFLRKIPGISHALETLDAHNFDKSYATIADADILHQSRRNSLGIARLF